MTGRPKGDLKDKHGWKMLLTFLGSFNYFVIFLGECAGQKMDKDLLCVVIKQRLTSNRRKRDLKDERVRIMPQLISCRLPPLKHKKPFISCGSFTSCIELGRSAKLTVIGFVCNFSNISPIRRAHPMVEMTNAIIQKILSIQGHIMLRRKC